jgi:hypothetical protein
MTTRTADGEPDVLAPTRRRKRGNHHNDEARHLARGQAMRTTDGAAYRTSPDGAALHTSPAADNFVLGLGGIPTHYGAIADNFVRALGDQATSENARTRPALRRSAAMSRPDLTSHADEASVWSALGTSRESASVSLAGDPDEVSARMAPRPVAGTEPEVQLHVGTGAQRAARSVGAAAFTVGTQIVLGEQAQTGPDSTAILAHELAHARLNATAPASALPRIQRQGLPEVAPVAPPRSPTDLQPGSYTVLVVGSPGPGELPGHAFQFADAAAQVEAPSRVWLVEQTGYQAGGVDLAGIQTRARGAPVFWITPSSPLPALLRQFPPASIAALRVFSHGVPGMVTLRYGGTIPNYGLDIAGAQSLSPEQFRPDAEITFDSCNTATDPSLFPGLPDEKRSLAAEVANATGLPVTAWVGRTSYRQVNRGTGGVVGSEIMSGLRPDFTELYSSTLRQRTPQQVVTAPTRSPGDWTSWFRMRARLPETRRFPVSAGATVVVTIDADSEFVPMRGAPITVILHREVDLAVDRAQSRRATIGQETVLTWPDCVAGTYYLELFHMSGLEVVGTIAVTVR